MDLDDDRVTGASVDEIAPDLSFLRRPARDLNRNGIEDALEADPDGWFRRERERVQSDAARRASSSGGWTSAGLSRLLNVHTAIDIELQLLNPAGKDLWLAREPEDASVGVRWNFTVRKVIPGRSPTHGPPQPSIVGSISESE